MNAILMVSLYNTTPTTYITNHEFGLQVTLKFCCSTFLKIQQPFTFHFVIKG